MIDLLSQCVFRVTCYHEIAGVVVQYASDPFAYAVCLREDKYGNIVLQWDVQCYLLTMVIVATTSLKVPHLMAPYAKYFGENGAPEWEKTTWGDFQDALEKQSAAVKKAESERDVKFLFLICINLSQRFLFRNVSGSMYFCLLVLYPFENELFCSM